MLSFSWHEYKRTEETESKIKSVLVAKLYKSAPIALLVLFLTSAFFQSRIIKLLFGQSIKTFEV